MLLLLLYAAYLFLRGAIADPERRGVFCAAYALFSGFVMPFLMFVVPGHGVAHPADRHQPGGEDPDGDVLSERSSSSPPSRASRPSSFWMWDLDRRLERMETDRPGVGEVRNSSMSALASSPASNAVIWIGIWAYLLVVWIQGFPPPSARSSDGPRRMIRSI